MDSNDDYGFRPFDFDASDGLRLHARDYGGDNPATRDRLPLLCLPGLTRNSRDFHQLALILSQDASSPRRVIALDYRGRGLSQWDSDRSHYNLLVEANDVLSLCSALGISRAAFIGTSRGGLILHMLAATRSELLGAVILNDVGPALERRGLEQIRDYLSRSRPPQNWKDAVDILKEIHGASFTALVEEDWHDMAQSLYREADGSIVADFDPAIAEQMRSLDMEKLGPDLWPQFEGLAPVPLMVIRGENTTLLSVETLEEMKRRHPRMTALTVSMQGHAPILHLSNIPERIRTFLSSV
ncbi:MULTISPECIES: alpha/beta fold hydrolase [unclassified Sinorhizobium]|uniref:alpha/beta fold hydrolase n=1 Tax=unclassified Sinorhizobium TaxID=2613772 RepID=UPI003523E748